MNYLSGFYYEVAQHLDHGHCMVLLNGKPPRLFNTKSEVSAYLYGVVDCSSFDYNIPQSLFARLALCEDQDVEPTYEMVEKGALWVRGEHPDDVTDEDRCLAKNLYRTMKRYEISGLPVGRLANLEG